MRRYPISSKRASTLVAPLLLATVLLTTRFHREFIRLLSEDSRWPLLITATPRSGTVATARLLRKLGLDVSTDDCLGGSGLHAHGFVSWKHSVVDDHYFHSCQLNEEVVKLGPEAKNKTKNFEVLVHQTKEILPSITSLIGTEPLKDAEYLSFVSRHINMTGANTTEKKGLRMWVEWQEHVRNVTSWRYKFEDLLDESKYLSIVERIFQSANQTLPNTTVIHEKWTEWSSRKHNSRPHRPCYTWSELIKIDATDAERAKKLAETYGYEVVGYDVDVE